MGTGRRAIRRRFCEQSARRMETTNTIVSSKNPSGVRTRLGGPDKRCFGVAGRVETSECLRHEVDRSQPRFGVRYLS